MWKRWENGQGGFVDALVHPHTHVVFPNFKQCTIRAIEITFAVYYLYVI